ncbi:unnamed protein product [Amoebophrya sp. A25]|nr:unnamed protein product [Amoebophrya sp. A25]|eukprot:GSA25T00019592001.1
MAAPSLDPFRRSAICSKCKTERNFFGPNEAPIFQFECRAIGLPCGAAQTGDALPVVSERWLDKYKGRWKSVPPPLTPGWDAAVELIKEKQRAAKNVGTAFGGDRSASSKGTGRHVSQRKSYWQSGDPRPGVPDPRLETPLAEALGMLGSPPPDDFGAARAEVKTRGKVLKRVADPSEVPAPCKRLKRAAVGGLEGRDATAGGDCGNVGGPSTSSTLAPAEGALVGGAASSNRRGMMRAAVERVLGTAVFNPDGDARSRLVAADDLTEAEKADLVPQLDDEGDSEWVVRRKYKKRCRKRANEEAELVMLQELVNARTCRISTQDVLERMRFSCPNFHHAHEDSERAAVSRMFSAYECYNTLTAKTCGLNALPKKKPKAAGARYNRLKKVEALFDTWASWRLLKHKIRARIDELKAANPYALLPHGGKDSGRGAASVPWHSHVEMLNMDEVNILKKYGTRGGYCLLPSSVPVDSSGLQLHDVRADSGTILAQVGSAAHIPLRAPPVVLPASYYDGVSANVKERLAKAVRAISSFGAASVSPKNMRNGYSTRGIFQEYVASVMKQKREYEAQHRRRFVLVLLIDDSNTHKLSEYEMDRYQNDELIYFLRVEGGATSLAQPVDLGRAALDIHRTARRANAEKEAVTFEDEGLWRELEQMKREWNGWHFFESAGLSLLHDDPRQIPLHPSVASFLNFTKDIHPREFAQLWARFLATLKLDGASAPVVA